MMFSTVSGNAWALTTAGTTKVNSGTSRRMATLRRLWAGLMCGALGACTSSGEPPLRLGTTYTVEQSGALALLDSLARPTPTTVVGPSGQILAAAARGDLDIVITHAPSLEQRLLVAPGHVLLACPFVASRFAIVGPAADPAHVGAAPSAADAFRRLAAAAGPAAHPRAASARRHAGFRNARRGVRRAGYDRAVGRRVGRAPLRTRTSATGGTGSGRRAARPLGLFPSVASAGDTGPCPRWRTPSHARVRFRERRHRVRPSAALVRGRRGGFPTRVRSGGRSRDRRGG